MGHLITGCGPLQTKHERTRPHPPAHLSFWYLKNFWRPSSVIGLIVPFHPRLCLRLLLPFPLALPLPVAAKAGASKPSAGRVRTGRICVELAAACAASAPAAMAVGVTKCCCISAASLRMAAMAPATV